LRLCGINSGAAVVPTGSVPDFGSAAERERDGLQHFAGLHVLHERGDGHALGLPVGSATAIATGAGRARIALNAAVAERALLHDGKSRPPTTTCGV